jgi:hypothetical protein
MICLYANGKTQLGEPFHFRLQEYPACLDLMGTRQHEFDLRDSTDVVRRMGRLGFPCGGMTIIRMNDSSIAVVSVRL